jgi:hypothetical protein
MFLTNVVDKITTHISCSVLYCRKSCLLRMTWKSTVQPHGQEITLRTVAKSRKMWQSLGLTHLVILQKWRQQTVDVAIVTATDILV